MPSSHPNWSTASVLTVSIASFSIGVAAADAVRASLGSSAGFVARSLSTVSLPEQAQLFDPVELAVLAHVPPPSEFNGTSVFVPPGKTLAGMVEKPFHVYDEAFLEILGSNPTLTLIAQTDSDPLFHEAVVWHRATDEAFFAQNAGAPAAGTGKDKSAIIQKISLKEAMAVAGMKNAVGKVKVQTVPTNPQVLNPNGATNYNGNFIFTGEGMGLEPSALYLVNPEAPYNTTVLVNNYYGRQFNSLNDVAVNSRNKNIYFTDVTYGYFQDFRPAPVLPNQVYRLNPETMAVTVVADGFRLPNGIIFSPDGQYAYITDTGTNSISKYDYTAPATIYRFTVAADGTFGDRKTFAFISTGIPDGIHTDAKGNVYAGCGDGVHVWNPSGTLLGRIFTNGTSANFNFMGSGRMVICAETRLYYVTLAACGAPFF